MTRTLEPRSSKSSEKERDELVSRDPADQTTCRSDRGLAPALRPLSPDPPNQTETDEVSCAGAGCLTPL
ncbi:unnamed protein product [Merluccius merluccius]